MKDTLTTIGTINKYHYSIDQLFITFMNTIKIWYNTANILLINGISFNLSKRIIIHLLKVKHSEFEYWQVLIRNKNCYYYKPNPAG